MSIIIIVAQSKNGTIGVNGALPWHLSDDLKRFRKLTTGNTVIMGRKTWDSIGRPLPDRHNIVITRTPELCLEGAQTVTSLEEALRVAPIGLDQFIIGGAEIYNLALPKADSIEMTLIHKDVAGDTFFPLLSEESWRKSVGIEQVDEKSGLQFSYVAYHRRGSS